MSVHVGFLIGSVEKVEEENDLADISKLCQLLDKLFDFNLKFDEKIQKPMMDLRFLWKYENQGIKIEYFGINLMMNHFMEQDYYLNNSIKNLNL
ncbi:10170_t:CDS:2 [Entrophospora sp. SA101]|nr:10170_t:CDS:2 [Entrophospora sp. SA101]